MCDALMKTYDYDGRDGVTYKGRAAFVLNHLDSAEAAMNDNFRDLTGDAIITDEDVRDEVRLKDAIDYVLDHARDIAPYIA